LQYGGGAPGFRYPGSLHYAVDRPFLTLFGEEQSPGPFLKAAVMMENIIQGHPFTDGK
jgi:death-on-curing protein